MNQEREAYLAGIDTEERRAREALAFARKNLKKHKKDLGFAYTIMANSVKGNEAVGNLLKKIKATKTAIAVIKKQLPSHSWAKHLERDGERVLISIKCFCSYKRLSKEWDYCPYCGRRVVKPTETTVMEKELIEEIHKYLEGKEANFNIVCSKRGR